MKWQQIETVPRDGEEILVCNANQGNVKQLIWWDKIHGYWVSNGKPELNIQSTHWLHIPDKGKV